MNRLLEDRTTYAILPNDPTTKYKKLLVDIVKEGSSLQILNKKELDFLVPLAPRVPIIYYLPKVHKNPTNPPGRPIVSGIDSVTSRIGKYIDHYLQPLVKLVPSYLKDTGDTIRLLEKIRHQGDILLVTADVAALYTCIPHHLGLAAVETFLTRNSLLPILQRNFIMELLVFATKHNYFWFQGVFYSQIRGVAMGAKYAPSLANLFMAQWEEDVVYALRRPELLLWARYIDDVLFLWKGDMESLDAFMIQWNDNDRGIVLSYEASPTSIHFLDLEISTTHDKLEFKTYFKPTDRNGYIPVDSCHHRRWLESVPRSQFLRLRRNCTRDSDFHLQSDMLKTRFLDKGYEPALVDNAINLVSATDRTSLLQVKPKTAKHDSFRWSFFTSYSIQHSEISKILNRHWKILLNDRILGPSLPNRAGIIFRGARSVQSDIAPNTIDPPKKISFFPEANGYYPCRSCNVCVANTIVRRKIDSFSSTVTGRIYTMKQFTTCFTSFIVYLITCPCKSQYIGRTIRNFSIRVNEHIAKIRKGCPKHTVSRHYLEHHNSDPKGSLFQVIDRFVPHWRGDSRLRGVSRLETFWIHELRCYTPYGMNVDWDINCFINQG